MRCPNCGFELANSAVAVCPRCAYTLAATPPRDAGSGGIYADWGAPPADQGATQDRPPAPGYPDYGAPMPPPPYAAPPSMPLGGPPNPYQPGPYQSGPYGAPPSQPLAPGQTAPGGWPPPPEYGAPGYGAPGYGAPGFGMPGQPSGYAPYGAPPSMPLAPGQTYPGYPGYAPLPPKPAKKSRVPVVVGALVAVVLVVAAVGGLYVLSQNGSAPSAGAPGGSTPAIVTSPGVTPTPTEATLYADSLASGATGWADDAAHCFDKADGYHIKNGYDCFAPIGDQGDVHVTVDVKEVSGPTTYAYGIVLRHLSQGNYYLFGVDANSKWVFLKCAASQSDCTRVVDFTADSHIHGGLNQVNTLDVVAKGAHFTFKVNGVVVGQADDATYSSGRVGLIAGYDTMEAVFTNITVSKPV